jgi:hypothetical protein
MQNVPHQDCPLFKLSTELRLEICRFAIQQDLNVISSTPHSYNSASRPLRGALALLHTCRALRAESIDAMEPLARAFLFALYDDEVNAIMADSTSLMIDIPGTRAGTTETHTAARHTWPPQPMTASRLKAEKVYDLLAFTRAIDEK